LVVIRFTSAALSESGPMPTLLGSSSASTADSAPAHGMPNEITCSILSVSCG
jgi:hypothetical protein